MDFIPKRNLPRLSAEFYRGLAFVHWILTIEERRTGWLTRGFYHEWQLALLHVSARYELICPAQVVMPDHAHLVWLGLNERGSDQRIAMEFLRKTLRPQLLPAEWQRQPFDRVLPESERKPGEFYTAAGYILDNPVRAGLVTKRSDYPFLGCCAPGYPRLDVGQEDYWEKFWRIYNREVERR